MNLLWQQQQSHYSHYSLKLLGQQHASRQFQLNVQIFVNQIDTRLENV